MPLILPKPGEYEMEEKKSVFHGYCAPVQTDADVKNVMEQIRQRFPDAGHHAFAYSLKTSNTIRFNDGGEPGGTAGMPILNVFQKTGVIDFICVVTRYFGGIHLGAGGLVRAYGRTAKGAMLAAEPEEQVFYKAYRVVCDYPQLDIVKYNFGKLGLEAPDWQYTHECTAILRVREDLVPMFLEGNNYRYERIEE